MSRLDIRSASSPTEPPSMISAASPLAVASIWPTGGRPRRQHCMVNPIIRLKGDEAQVESYVVMFRESEGGPKVAYGGRYIDHVVKQDGRWLFRRRKIISDLDPDETGASVHGMKP